MSKQPITSLCVLGGLVFATTVSAQNSEFRVLHAFSGSDGNEPTSVVRASDGSICGVTLAGGGTGVGNGVLYHIDTMGGFRTVHVFTDQPDGAIPGRLL